MNICGYDGVFVGISVDGQEPTSSLLHLGGLTQGALRGQCSTLGSRISILMLVDQKRYPLSPDGHIFASKTVHDPQA